jgi:hypothetical protein
MSSPSEIVHVLGWGYTLSLVALVLLLIVCILCFASGRPKEPIVVNFDDALAPLPYPGCIIRPELQIPCRLFESMELGNDTIEFYQFGHQKRQEFVTFREVVSTFSHMGRTNLGLRPVPPHVISLYMSGVLKIPFAYRDRKIVCLGLIWETQDGRRFVCGIGRDKNGKLTECEFGEHAKFGPDHVFAVYRPRICIPHGVLAQHPATA